MFGRALGTLGTVVAIVVAVLISPIALVAIDSLWRGDWNRLADIGQTYGVVSAVFSALAVVGVAASLFYQARTHRLARVQSVRGAHRELLNRVMDNPAVYGPALGFQPSQGGTPLEQHLMVTAWVGYLYSAYDSGTLAEEDLRNEGLAALFSGAIGRRWWENASRSWTESRESKERRFGRILDDVYRRSIITEPAVDEISTPPVREEKFKSGHAYLALTVATVAIIGGSLIRRRFRERNAIDSRRRGSSGGDTSRRAPGSHPPMND